MIKRVSLVTKRPELSRQQFIDRWLGEHVQVALQLPGLREYVIDFALEPDGNDPDGIATLRFDSREACDAAFAVPSLRDALRRTREDFAESAQVLFVDERIILRQSDGLV
jgi:uncharacterized protein (TIGR02118 family)